MVNLKYLNQYTDLQKEVKETREKIERLESSIEKLEKAIERIENENDIVIDKVYGGYGGTQSFKIEGIPIKEYKSKKTLLLTKRLRLNQRMHALEDLELDLIEKTTEIEKFISEVDDSRMRRIINYRFIDNLTWNEVADRIGGGNTEDGVRISFYRFMQK